MSKKKIASLFITGILSVGLIGGSFAWFTSKDSVTNAFEIVDADIADNIESGVKIVEEFSKEEAKNMIPGTKIDKVVSVKNTASYSQFIRVKIDKVWKYNGEIVTHYIEKVEIVDDSQGNSKEIKKYEYLTKEQVSNNKGAIPLDESLIVLNFNKGNMINIYNKEGKWIVNDKDEYYYCYEKTESQYSTKVLLEKVELSLDVSIVYKGLAFDVIVTAEGIQAENNALGEAWPSAPEQIKELAKKK